MNRTIMAQFIKNELDAYISTQRVYYDPVGIDLIIKAFEAYEEYKRLVSPPQEESVTVAFGVSEKDKKRYTEAFSAYKDMYGKDI